MFDGFYQSYKEEFINVINKLESSLVEKIMNEIEKARINDNNIFIVGNGGSASYASHWVCDFAKGVNVEGIKRFKAYSPVDNVAISTALGNDISYNDIFIEQIKNNFKADDLIIGLSVSGSSENIVRAFKYVKENKGRVISLIGAREGVIKEYSDLALIIPSLNYGIVKDVHIFLNHVISQYLRIRYQEIASGGDR